MRTTTLAAVLITGLLYSSLFGAQAPTDRLIDQLQQQYPLTKLTADKTGVVTAGAVLKLRKNGLVMAPSASTDVSGNSYKAGKITQSAFGKANEKANKVRSIFDHLPIPGVSGIPSAPTIATRNFVTGEKLNVTNIEYRNGAVVFELYSADAYNDTYYKTSLTFPSEKGAVPSAAEMLAATGEVFSVTPGDDSNAASTPAPTASLSPTTSAQAATPAPQPPAYGAIAPPPPPAPELKLGLTVDEVVSQLGQPATMATAGGKQIYLFKDWKVTFVKGKVADIDVR